MERTKKKITYVDIVAILCLAAAMILLLILVLSLKPPSPTEIYEKATDNVVELMTETKNIGQGFGTAEILDKDGTLITNAHVVTYTQLGAKHKFDSYYIRFSFEEYYREVELIRYDFDLDLAILKFKKIPDFKLKPIKIGNSSKLKSGDTIYAVGNSQNYGISISQGIIGIPLINIEYDDTIRSVIQCDITITEGNSGGALLDAKGKLVGITTFRTKDNKGNVIYGIAYCIPIDIVMRYINS